MELLWFLTHERKSPLVQKNDRHSSVIDLSITGLDIKYIRGCYVTVLFVFFWSGHKFTFNLNHKYTDNAFTKKNNYRQNNSDNAEKAVPLFEHHTCFL